MMSSPRATSERITFCAVAAATPGGAFPLTEIFHYADFVPVDVVLAIQRVTPIGRDRKTSRKLGRSFGKRGQDGDFARRQIDELQYRWRPLCIHKVNPALTRRPEA